MELGKFSPEEEVLLIKLLGKMSFPVSPQVFSALMEAVVSVPIELVVLNCKGQILLFQRNDKEYGQNWHSPGTVLRPGETVQTAMNRLIQSELGGAEITQPTELGWKQIMKGVGVGQNPTRQEISILHFSRLIDEYKGKGTFFDLNSLPELIPHHYSLITEVLLRAKKALLID